MKISVGYANDQGGIIFMDNETTEVRYREEEWTDYLTLCREYRNDGAVPSLNFDLSGIFKSEFVERFLELSLFYGLSSPLNSEMICIFPYF